jgi:hypothetical protein
MHLMVKSLKLVEAHLLECLHLRVTCTFTHMHAHTHIHTNTHTHTHTQIHARASRRTAGSHTAHRAAPALLSLCTSLPPGVWLLACSLKRVRCVAPFLLLIRVRCIRALLVTAGAAG